MAALLVLVCEERCSQAAALREHSEEAQPRGVGGLASGSRRGGRGWRRGRKHATASQPRQDGLGAGAGRLGARPAPARARVDVPAVVCAAQEMGARRRAAGGGQRLVAAAGGLVCARWRCSSAGGGRAKALEAAEVRRRRASGEQGRGAAARGSQRGAARPRGGLARGRRRFEEFACREAEARCAHEGGGQDRERAGTATGHGGQGDGEEPVVAPARLPYAGGAAVNG